MIDDRKKIEILYDGQCPICTDYCTKVQLKEGEGELVLLDARKKGELLDEVTAKGLDIDQGMVVRRDGQLFYGSEAMREIVKLKKKAGSAERFFFGGQKIAAVVYSVCKTARNVVLRVLGIRKIGNLKK